MAVSDWHPEDIKAAIRKRGVSVAELAEINGLKPVSIRMAYRRPWPRVEAIIAQYLGHHPSTIWPSRYGPDGKPLIGRVRRAKTSGTSEIAHRQKEAAR